MEMRRCDWAPSLISENLLTISVLLDAIPKSLARRGHEIAKEWRENTLFLSQEYMILPICCFTIREHYERWGFPPTLPSPSRGED